MKHFLTVFLVLCFSSFTFSNTQTDSLVCFSDLSFHSEFEKQAFLHCRQGDDFNLCLAADKNMTSEKATSIKNNFNEVLNQLQKEKLTVKNLRSKFKNAHKIIFFKSPMQYYENAEFSDILTNGYFNYVTASVLYSQVLKGLNIPSYYLFTLSKTDIVINPNADQTILETLNLKDENGYFNSSDNNQLIVNILDKNMRIGSQYQYNSSGETSLVRFKESELLKENQLAATIYFYKAFQKLNENKTEDSYGLISKACYLYPCELFEKTMYAILDERLKVCKFDKVEDVDLLGQLSRFRENNFEIIKNDFQRIIGKHVSDQNDFGFCTAVYNRLLPQIKDVMLADEISYAYYLGAAFLDKDGTNLEPAFQLLKLKPNDKNVLHIIESKFENMKYRSENKEALIDSLDKYDVRLNNTEVTQMITNVRLILYLDLARSFFQRNQLKEGIKYISRFESTFKLPLRITDFRVKIEDAYYEYASYYLRFNNRAMAQKIVNKGLEYIPHSNMIESATYVFPVTKPFITKRKMTRSEYDKYMKKIK